MCCKDILKIFLNGTELPLNSVNSVISAEFDKSLKHELGSILKIRSLMMCLAGAVVVSWCLTQEVAGSGPFNDKDVLETFRGKN